jgi:uncharacterized membrane protein
MYRIIGGDQKEYGPVTAEDIRHWITEGRANGQTSATPEGITDWRPLSTFPEFADVLAAKGAAVAQPPLAESAQGLPADIFSRDYDLDIGGCIGSAWSLLKTNFGPVFGGTAIFFLIQIGLGVVGAVPLVGLVGSVASLITAGPLMGGLYYLLLRNIRRQPSDIGDLFAGFRLAFAQLLLGYLVIALLTFLAMLPGLLMTLIPIVLMVRQHAGIAAGPVLVALVGFVIAMIPATYLGTSWVFALPLIIDRRMEFWPAMSASRRMVAKHWWLVFGLLVVCGLIYLAGFCVCGVGLFFALPVMFGAMMYAYESIFSAPAARTP